MALNPNKFQVKYWDNMFETKEQSTSKKPDRYSQVGELSNSTSRKVVFDMLGANVDMSKPPLSEEDLKSLTSPDEDLFKYSQHLSIGDLPHHRPVLQRKLKSSDLRKKLNSNRESNRYKEQKSPTLSKTAVAPSSSYASNLNSVHVATPKIYKDPDSQFGNIPTSIDQRILNDNHNKKTDKKDDKHSKSDSKRDKDAHKISKAENKSHVDKTKKKDEKKTYRGDKREQKEHKKGKSKGEKDINKEEKKDHKDQKKRHKEDIKVHKDEKKVNSKEKESDKFKSNSKADDKAKPEKKVKACKDSSSEIKKADSVLKHNQSKKVETIEAKGTPIYKRLADKYNPRPRRPSTTEVISDKRTVKDSVIKPMEVVNSTTSTSDNLSSNNLTNKIINNINEINTFKKNATEIARCQDPRLQNDRKQNSLKPPSVSSPVPNKSMNIPILQETAVINNEYDLSKMQPIDFYSPSLTVKCPLHSPPTYANHSAYENHSSEGHQSPSNNKQSHESESKNEIMEICHRKSPRDMDFTFRRVSLTRAAKRKLNYSEETDEQELTKQSTTTAFTLNIKPPIKKRIVKGNKRHQKWASSVIIEKKKGKLNSISVTPSTEDEQQPCNNSQTSEKSNDDVAQKSDKTVHKENKNENIQPDVNYYFDPLENTQCKVCSFKGKFIVQHYKSVHPSHEVLISRVSPGNSKEAINESIEKRYEDVVIPEVNETKVRRRKFTYQCRFCQMLFNSETSQCFFDHVTSHTGEYRLLCNFCPFKTFSSKSLTCHFHTSHHVNIEQAGTIIPLAYPAPPDFHLVFGHICGECNFIQMNKSAIEKHIEDYHTNGDRKIYKISMSTVEVAQPLEEPGTSEVDDSQHC